MSCGYDAGTDALTLIFQEGLLTKGAKSGDLTGVDQRDYAQSLGAWRSLAEMVAADAVSLVVDVARYDIGYRVDPTSPDRAATLATQGFGGDWSIGIGKPTAVPLAIPAATISAIISWASRLLSGATTPGATKRSFSFPTNKSLGTQGDVLRISIHVVRTAALQPVSQMKLRPLTQQPGLYRAPQDGTLASAWDAVKGFGFGDTMDAASLGADAWASLDSARADWLVRHQQRTGPVRVDDDARDRSPVATAFIAHLDGSDWFKPKGKPASKRRPVQALAAPLGFAPCRPDPTLGVVTQTALERLGLALRDAIDLGYACWVTDNVDTDGSKWRATMDLIVGLATPDANGDSPLGVFTSALCNGLLFPQSQVCSDNDTRITDLGTAITGGSSDLSHLRAAVQRMLMADPGLYADAKALLLTALRFGGSSGTGVAPPSSLARGRFRRIISLQPQPQQPQRPPQPFTAAAGAQAATSVVGVDDLVFTASAASTSFDDALGFLEPLGVTRYNHRFYVPPEADTTPASYDLDTVEAMIDPANSAAWTRAPIVVPLKAANEDPSKPRPVDLASRSIVAPPTLLWFGRSDPLAVMMTQQQPGWSLSRLMRGYLDRGGETNDLVEIGRRYAAGEAPTTEDEDLVFALYRVSGDDDTLLTSTTSIAESLASDGFFLRVAAQDSPTSPAPSGEADINFRTLLFAAPGSSDAAGSVTKLALSNPDFKAMTNAMIGPSLTLLPPTTDRLVRLLGNQVFVAPLADSAQRLPLVLFLAPTNSSTAPTGTAPVAYVLVAYVSSLWTDRYCTFTHGRNLPFSQWGGANAPNDWPRFAEQFWQAAPQSAPGLHLRFAKPPVVNHELDWPSRIVDLDAKTWLGQNVPFGNLVKRLLLTPGVVVGASRPDQPLLNVAAADIDSLVSPNLSVTTYQEQFVESDHEPDNRFPLVNASSPASSSSQVWFPYGYVTYSIDFQWYTQSHYSRFRLERIFVRLKS